MKKYEVTIISNGNFFKWEISANNITSNEVGCILFWSMYYDNLELIAQAPKEALVILLPDAS